MTHVTITDASTVTLNGVSGSASVTGPLTVCCESVTIGTSTYTGTILVASGQPFQLLRYSPALTEFHAPLLCLALILGLIASRWRL